MIEKTCIQTLIEHLTRNNHFRSRKLSKSCKSLHITSMWASNLFLPVNPPQKLGSRGTSCRVIVPQQFTGICAKGPLRTKPVLGIQSRLATVFCWDDCAVKVPYPSLFGVTYLPTVLSHLVRDAVTWRSKRLNLGPPRGYMEHRSQ